MTRSSPALVIGIFGFALALAIIIGSRLSEQTMSLLMGAACGAGLTAPLAIVAGMYIGAQRAARAQKQQPSAPVQPSIVVMTPPQQSMQPALPQWNTAYPAVHGYSIPERRQYTILGEETIIDGNDTHHVS
jgi:hypothetical protein